MTTRKTYRKVLTVAEFDRLAQVPTTREQAQQIWDRCEPMLEALRNGQYYRGVIGCPHCDDHRPHLCSTCAWGPGPVACFRGPTFGGVWHHEIEYLQYMPTYEIVLVWADVMAYRRDETDILGHLQWANLLLTGDMECAKVDYRESQGGKS